MLKNRMKRTVALLFALVLTLGCIGVNTTQSFAASSTKVGTAYYTVTSAKNLTAQYAKPTKKTCTSATIPATVKISGKSYKVTSIAANAFSGCTKLKKVTIGKNVTKIGKKAFYGCKALTTVTINTTKLTSSKVGANAFKGINAKAVVKVPSAKLASYKKILVAKGLTGKNQTVKAKVESGSESSYTETSFDPDKDYFVDSGCAFRIGDISATGSNYHSRYETDSVSYSVGDTVSFSSKIELQYPVYGKWREKEASGGYIRCQRCGKYFDNDLVFGMHGEMEFDGCGAGTSYAFGTKDSFTAWEFVPDTDPCNVVFDFVLPSGVSYQDGSLKVVHYLTQENLVKNCDVKISDNKITVTIEDVKSLPFYTAFDYDAYCKDPHIYGSSGSDDYLLGSIIPITVVFDTTVNNNAGISNNVSSSVSYIYKGAEHTLNYDDVSVHTAGLKISNTGSDGSSISDSTFTLYQQKAVYPEGSNYGTLQWIKIAENIKPGTVLNGLSIGDGKWENVYKLTQTSVPDGYKTAGSTEFTLTMESAGGTVKVSAVGKNGSLPVDGNVISISVVNEKDSSKAVTTATETPSSGQNTEQTASSSENTSNTPVTPPASGKTQVSVKAMYYKDGVWDHSMTYKQTVDYPDNMMDGKNVHNESSLFNGYVLAKITLNGVVVDSLPEKIENGSEVGFYYVSQ